MTANAGKGANGRSGARSTGAGGKNQRKRSSAAKKSTGDEVTVNKTDAEPDGAGAADKAEETVVDFAASKKTGAEDTVQDIKLPGRLGKPADDAGAKDGKVPADPTGDAAGSKDRLVARGTDHGDGAGSGASDQPKSGDISFPSGRTTSMDMPSAQGFGGPGSSGSRGSTGTARPTQPPSYGSARTMTSLEPARGSGEQTRPDRATAARKSPRKAHLQVARFEPWSVMKFSFIMSLVCFLVLFVAVFVLYLILSGLGVFDALTNTIRDLQGKSSGGLNPASWFSAARILGYTALIGTLNVLLITALATVWSVIYNMAADLVGGVEVTLKEADQ